MEREDKEFAEDENLEQNAHQEERAEIEQMAREMLDRNGAEMPEELHELLERIAQGGEAAQLEEQLKAVREKRRIADRTGGACGAVPGEARLARCEYEGRREKLSLGI